MLSWYELPEDDRPPERIWLDDEALQSHFDGVDQKRKAGSRGTEVVPQDLDQNELTAQLRR